MEQNVMRLNLGCGSAHLEGFVNVDAYGECDINHDLNTFPYPWEDNTIDEIQMHHILEHIPNWWVAFCECARILKPGGKLEIRVPDESSRTALTYRDHYHVFSMVSFHGIIGASHGTNAWAKEEQDKIPLVMNDYKRVPHKEFYWMTRWPFRWLLQFCANHMRNFIHEQRFLFIKVGENGSI